MPIRDLRTGQVAWAVLEGAHGREQTGRRPVVVIASNTYLEIVTTLAMIVPVTTTERGWPNHVRLTGATGLSRPSWAMTEQIVTISRTRLVDRAGSVDEPCIDLIRLHLRDFLGFR
ncbi:type II toxin-antitoxin system PemK/MazF family toxin [uncultured Amnibacterium sp.]|uniref:type II toxin-antitoxin system PemK/MazF family toxin n=1 Tax=uncultured Amnibacterium sp. TaxID=1631851 RepID=UPI0035CA83BC